jgi:hypothetical protein
MSKHSKVQPNGVMCFELAGESLEAALELEKEIRAELKRVPVQQTGNLGDIQESWAAFYAGLLKRLETEKPELLELCGLHAGAVQVTEVKDGMPRAYLSFPQIFSSPEKEPRYFMYAPVDHAGHYFEPEGATQVTGAREKQVNDLLFAGGWLGNAPLVTAKREGVALPADYTPPSAVKGPPGAETRGWRCFVAEGESLSAVEDCERRTQEYHAAVERVRGIVEMLAEKEFPELLKKAPPGEELRAQVSYSYGGALEGKTEIRLSVRLEGKANMWNAGKTVPLADGPHYALADTGYGEYVVTAKPGTVEGRLLDALMKEIPPTPSLADYPALLGDFRFKPSDIEAALGIDGVVPQARNLGGKKLLVYHTDDAAKSDFCPPGAKPLSTAAFLWLQADEADRNTGVTPPPMPPAIAAALPPPPKPGFKLPFQP